MAKSKQTTQDIQEAIKAISSAAAEAVRTISQAAAEAKSVVSANASDAARVLAVTNSGDHDLLQRVDTKVDALKDAVEKLTSRDNLFVLKTDFEFFRNILVGTMLVTIFVSIVMRFIAK